MEVVKQMRLLNYSDLEINFGYILTSVLYLSFLEAQIELSLKNLINYSSQTKLNELLPNVYKEKTKRDLNELISKNFDFYEKLHKPYLFAVNRLNKN